MVAPSSQQLLDSTSIPAATKPSQQFGIKNNVSILLYYSGRVAVPDVLKDVNSSWGKKYLAGTDCGSCPT